MDTNRNLVLGSFLILVIFIMVWATFSLSNKYTTENQVEVVTQPQIAENYQPEVLQASSAVCHVDLQLVIDVSQSMTNVEYDGRTKMEWAIEAADEFVERLEDYNQNPGSRVRIGLTQFGRTGLSDVNILQSLTGNFSAVSNAINNLDWDGPDGGSCILCGLNRANFDLVNNSTPTNRVAVLVSDGCGNRDWTDWREIQYARPLAIDVADDGRTEGITYYSIGYSTEGQEGDSCGVEQYDEGTLLGVAGDPSRLFYRPNIRDWVTTFRQLADSICDSSPEYACTIDSTVASSAANPLEIQYGETANIGTSFLAQSPMGGDVEVRYRTSTSGEFNILNGPNFNRPIAPGENLSDYYSNVNVRPSLSADPNVVTELVSEVFSGANLLCSTSTFMKVAAVESWWQVRGGDIVAVGGDIVSKLPLVPSGKKLMSFPYFGVPIYNGDIDPATTSSTGVPGWDADTLVSMYNTPEGSRYDYTYFYNKFHPTEIDAVLTSASVGTSTFTTPGAGQLNRGYATFIKHGGLTINSLRFDTTATNQKVILLVDGDVVIRNKILLEKGKDFFMLIASGNIKIAAEVGDSSYVDSGTAGAADLEGVYVTNNQFFTNNSEADTTKQLYVRGSVIGYGNEGVNNGIVFERDLGSANINYPAEIFEYAMDLVLNIPSFYSERNVNWKEVAP